MTQAIALGADGTVYSVQRAKGLSTIVAHTKSSARAVYETKELVRALWVSPAGVVHAGGKRHHTNLGGAWHTTNPKAGDIMALWGASETELFAGTLDGKLVRWTDGAWAELGAHDDMVTCIHGTDATNVYIGGDGVFWHWHGTTLEPQDATKDGNNVTGIFCTGDDLWVSTREDDKLYRNGAAIAKLPPGEFDDVYGLAIGTAGVFALGSAVVLELQGELLVPVAIPEPLLMAKRAEFSTAIVGDGARAVAGGALTVLVNDGNGFEPWPTVAAGSPIGGAKPAPKKSAPKATAPKKAGAKKPAPKKPAPKKIAAKKR